MSVQQDEALGMIADAAERSSQHRTTAKGNNGVITDWLQFPQS